jgi:hydroxymethylpyrimidine pyrophosphatase-like HAD family hydrolase
VSADQAYREADLAIDYCEDVAALPTSAVKQIVSLFDQAGAQAKVSSIHVNGWFGNYDKLAMTEILFSEIFNVELDNEKKRVLYVGDSPNDEPMFRYFPYSAGVKNVLNFTGQLKHPPAYVASRNGGNGFEEIVTLLLDVVE